jgi:AcrR family transcriptional regulator
MTTSEGRDINKPSKTRDRARFRAELIEVARRLFLQRGIQATSMVDIGREMGVSKPTVYEAFDSKHALIEAVFASAADDIDRSWVLNAMKSPIPFPDFLDLVAGSYKQLLRSPRQIELFMLVFREGMHTNEMLQIFIEQFVGPTIAARRKIVALAMERGECIELPVEVVQRLLICPFHFLMLDMAMYGEKGLAPEHIDVFIDQSFAALKHQLCGIPGQDSGAVDSSDVVVAA